MNNLTNLIWIVFCKVIAALANFIQIIDFIKNNFIHKSIKVPKKKQLKLRKQLLTRLQSDNLIRIENSLHNLIKIDLVMKEQCHQVGGKLEELIPEDSESETNPLNRLFKYFIRDKQQTTQLEPNQKIIEFLDRNDIQRKLLILGEPGAGKTTELLNLHKDLIQRAIQDEDTPIPVIFELSSWKNNQPIRKWLIEQLTDIYKGIPKKVAEQWIENEQLIPLLDGLDELGLEGENECIIALNQFLESSFQAELVVCCRREEYEQAQTKLEQLNSAIYLESLSDDQIQQYLKSLNRFSIWNANIRNESELLELCRKPLFLTMLVVAYQGKAIRNFSELFEAYIKQQLNDPNNQGIYPTRKSPTQKQTLHYLVWLAKKLENEGDTEFLIENIQPTWLESSKQKIVYRIVTISIVILTYGLLHGLLQGLFFGLYLGLSTKLFSKLLLGLIVGMLVGLSSGVSGGLVFGLLHWTTLRLSKIELVEQLNLSKNWLIAELIIGLFSGIIVGSNEGFIAGVIAGLFFVPIQVEFFRIIFGLRSGVITFSEFEDKNFPNQGIWNCLKNGLIIGLFFGLIIGLFEGLYSKSIPIKLNNRLFSRLFYGLNEALTFGIFFGMFFGLISVIKHFTLRVILYKNGDIPWNYAKFLKHTAKHRFIQQVGGRYRFIHNLLKKHFAQMQILDR